MKEQLKDLLLEYLGELMYDYEKIEYLPYGMEIEERIKAIELLLKK